MPHDAGTIAAEALSFTEKIRSATSGSHRRLETLPISQSIVSPTLDKASYGHYLALMRDVVRDTESVVAPMLSNVFSDLKERRKLDPIDADLAFIGRRPFGQTVFRKDEIGSVAFAAGIFYVVEGSALGGRFILNNIRQTLGFDEASGASYFYGYGNATGSFWKRFLDQLNTFEATEANGDAIIAGADYAFNAIHRHFEKNS